jgi:hypothetical protein
MLRLSSISGGRGEAPYVVSPTPTPTNFDQTENEEKNHPSITINGQFQAFLGSLSPRSLDSKSEDDFVFQNDSSTSPFHLQQQNQIDKPMINRSVRTINSISSTRELAFGSFDEDNSSNLRKYQNEYKKQCMGRLIFALLVFAVAAAVFYLRLKISQQDEWLKEHWKQRIRLTNHTKVS